MYRCTLLIQLLFYSILGLGNEIDTISTFLQKNSATPQQRAHALNQLSNIYRADSTQTSIEFAQEALALSIQHDLKVEEGLARQNLAECFLYNDTYDVAILYASDALEIFTALNDSLNIASSFTTLGWIYYDADDPETSLQYHNRALSFYKTLKDQKALSAAINAVGLTYAVQDEYEKAKPYFEESLQIGKAINDQNRMASALNNIGMSYSALGQYELALTNLQAAYQLSTSIHDNLRSAENLNQMALVHIKTGAYEKVEDLLKESFQLINSSPSNARKEKLLDYYLINADYYKAIKRFDLAFENLKSHEALLNEVLSAEKRNKLANNRLLYETQKKESEIQLLERENELKRWQRNAIAAGFVLLLIIGYQVYSRQRQIRQSEKKISDVKQSLIQKELDHSKLEADNLSHRLEHKQKEITTFALHVSQRNELLRSFLDQLLEIKSNTDKETGAKLNKIVSQFSKMQQTNKEAEDFHINVETEYKDFFFNLLQQFPDLTENEKRLCAQVRLNLSIKDIASLNNISVKSVEMARYRLRKRFNLEHEENLLDFLQKF